jgi:hypothetical protein
MEIFLVAAVKISTLPQNCDCLKRTRVITAVNAIGEDLASCNMMNMEGLERLKKWKPNEYS